MDENKLAKLRAVGLRLVNICATCKHGRFSGCSPHYGSCAKHSYRHIKHAGPPRDVSVRYDCACDDYDREVPLPAAWWEFEQGE